MKPIIKRSIFLLSFLLSAMLCQGSALAQTTNYPQLHWKLTNPGIPTNSSYGEVDFVNDVDGDRVSDVVYATGVSGSTVYLYSGKQKETNGQPHLIWKKQTMAGDTTTAITAIVAHQDISNDGKQEILDAYTVNGDAGIEMLDGATGAILKTYSVGLSKPILVLKSVPDVNNDHIKDIVASIRPNDAVAKIVLLDGNSLMPIWYYKYNTTIINGYSSEIRDIAIVSDVGGPNNVPDGIPDIVIATSVASDDGKNFLVLSGALGPPGESESTVQLLSSRNPISGLVDSIKQVNGSGQDILLMDTSATTVKLSRIKGGDLNNDEWQLTNGLANNSQLMKTIPDVNGDTYQDILLAYSASMKMVSGVNGTTLWEKMNFPMPLPLYPGYSSGPVYDYSADIVYDLNGDQVDDVVALKDTSPTTVYLLKGQDGSDVWNYSLDNSSTKGSRVFAKADLDGDQIPDIVVAANNGDLYVIASKQGSGSGGGKYKIEQPE